MDEYDIWIDPEDLEEIYSEADSWLTTQGLSSKNLSYSDFLQCCSDVASTSYYDEEDIQDILFNYFELNY